MKPEFIYKPGSRGFSLIEVIAAIILAAFLGAMLVQYMGTNLTSSVKSLVAAKNSSESASVMESITRDYRNWLHENPEESIQDFRQNIDEDDSYSGISTQMVKLKDNDPDDSILKVTVSSGDRDLVSLFTK
ncbi:MAG: PulJ/GspJ family protein [Desulfosalsimonas sp.]